MARATLLAAGFCMGHAGFSARYLWIQDCRRSSFHENLYSGLVDGFESAGMPFTKVFCPWTLDEVGASVEEVSSASANATSSEPVLNVVSVESGWQWPFLPLLYAGTRYVHFWMDSSPQPPYVVGLSLRFRSDNWMGGWLSGREFCIRAATSRSHLIAYIGASADSQDSVDRLHGFSVAVADQCPQHNNVHSVTYAKWSRELAEQVATGLFFREAAISTFVCANDDMALGVIDAATKVRPQGTGGLVVIGYDDTPDIRHWIDEGTVAVSMNRVRPNLIFAVVGVVKELCGMLAGPAPKGDEGLTGARVAARLGLNESDMTIESMPAPRVSDMEQFLMRETLDGYRPESRPFPGSWVGPRRTGGTAAGDACLVPNATLVEAQFELQTLKLENSRLLLTGLHRLWWQDPRLQFDFRVPGGTGCMQPIITEEERLWKPDIYFDTALKSSDIFDSSGEKLIQFDSSGRVTWIRRARLTLDCSMDFSMLPFDTQRCKFSQGLFRHDAEKVQMQWKAGVRGFVGWESGELKISEFDLIDVVEASVLGDSLLGDSGQWSYVQATLVLKRKSRYYVKYVLTPMLFFVLIAWASFFVSRSAAPARITLTMICFLALSRYVDSTLSQLPKDEGDVWLINILVASQHFVLYSVLEYALCNFWMREEARGLAAKRKAMDKFNMINAERRCPRRESSILGRVQVLGEDTLEPSEAVAKKREFVVDVKRKAGLIGRYFINANGDLLFRSQHIDVFSRVVFPLVYMGVLVSFAVRLD